MSEPTRPAAPAYVQMLGDLAVHLGRTLDTRSWVIHIFDSDGARSTFWTQSGDDDPENKLMPVRIVSPY